MALEVSPELSLMTSTLRKLEWHCCKLDGKELSSKKSQDPPLNVHEKGMHRLQVFSFQEESVVERLAQALS